MSLSQLINRPCRIVQRSDDGETDELGNEVPAETEIDTVCELQQRRRDEDEDQGEVSDTEWVAFLPIGTSLDTGDALIVDGEGSFEVIGQPERLRNPRTQVFSHIEATLRRTAGAEDGS